ncbi:MAG: NAD-glutamate dehydrogenase [Gammaproteobacteria bacterium]|nr:NAD-glutamate dehydrogenase [Gammaproteobacteria bacterium]
MRFGIEKGNVTPDQLIRLLLKSPVDLIWNGGIGTYVKASSENNAAEGNKTHDALRVNGSELRCKVIGEGGNLGLTQAARVEYGLRGGVSLTDFIDNSSGVGCSDHEVNIKILLNDLQSKNRLTERRRNFLLRSMTDEVAELVLANNYSQVQAIGIAQTQVDVRHKEYADLISYLEKHAGLDHGLEFLPDKEQLEERASKELYLTRPEISVITSYMKMHLKAELADVEYLDDAYLLPCLYGAFPSKLIQPYKSTIQTHALRREIVATQLANSIVNLLGPSFIYRMVVSTASSLAEVVKAAVIARDVFQVQDQLRVIEELDYKIAAATQAVMVSRLIRRVTRWLLRNRRSNLTLAEEVKFFASRVNKFRRMLPAKLPPDYALMFQEKHAHLTENGVPDTLAMEICRSDFLFPATSFIEISHASGEPLGNVVDIYYAIGEQLQLNWLGKIINLLPVANYWQAQARETYLDDLAWQQRALTDNVVKSASRRGRAPTRVAKWVTDNAVPIARANNMLTQLQGESQPDYAMFSVAMRELLTLAQATARKD